MVKNMKIRNPDLKLNYDELIKNKIYIEKGIFYLIKNNYKYLVKIDINGIFNCYLKGEIK